MSDDLNAPITIPGTRINRPAVLDLGAARLARDEEAQRRASEREFVVSVYLSTVVVAPPGVDPGTFPGMAPETILLCAADLVSDPGRLGEIARTLVARAAATSGVVEGVQHAG